MTTNLDTATFVAFIDFLFLRGLLPSMRSKPSFRDKDSDDYDPLWDQISQAFITGAFLFAIAQILVYNINVDNNGEQDSHWMEAPRRWNVSHKPVCAEP